MFTLLIVVSTVVILWLASYKLYKARNTIKKQKIEWLALAAFMSGFGILCYGARSLFTALPQIDTFLYRLGITVHLGLSFVPASLFVYKNFINNKIVRAALGGLTAAAALVFTYACIFPPLKRVVKMAPFEPIPMKVSNYPWVSVIWKNVFIWFCISISIILIYTVFHYSFKNRKEPKSASHLVLGFFLLLPLVIIIFLMPFVVLESWYPQWQEKIAYLYVVIAIAMLWLVNYLIEGKEEVDASLYYGLGIAYLLFPAMLCIFVTPIFARLLYLPGAIFLYLAYRREMALIEKETEQV